MEKPENFYCSLSYQTIPSNWEEDPDTGWVFSFEKKTQEELVELVFEYGLYFQENDDGVALWGTNFPQHDDFLNIDCHYTLHVKDSGGAEISQESIEKINHQISYMDDLLLT